MTTAQQLHEQAMELSWEERRELSELLLESLYPKPRRTEAEMEEIIRTRLADAEAGRTVWVSDEDEIVVRVQAAREAARRLVFGLSH